MKANRKFREGEEAVSAVIGVILMVAITVAIAATVFVYVNQMATPTETGKSVGAIYVSKNTGGGEQNVTYKITSADAGIDWTEVVASWETDTSETTGLGIFQTGATYAPMDGNIAVGDYFVVQLNASGTVNIDLIYDGHIIWTAPTVTVS